MEKRIGRIQKLIVATLVMLTMFANPILGNVTIVSAKTTKLSLYVRTTRYVRKNETKKVKKTQTVTVKNLSAKQKVSWKSNNKSLATVKAGKKGKAKLSVSLGKAGTAKVTATVRNKKNNKKVKVLTKKISIINKKAPIKPAPTKAVTSTIKPTATPIAAKTATPIPHSPIWVGTWGSSQYSIAATAAPRLKDSTFRQIVRVSTGGKKLRLTFSNEYGQSSMEIRSVHIAKPTVNGKSNIDVSTDTLVTFNGGSESVTIPARGKVVSDAIDYPTEALEKIAVSTHFGKTPSMLTHHAGSRSNSFLQEGNTVSSEAMGTSTLVRWYVLSNIDVLLPSESRSIVCFGDSITDGYGTDSTSSGPDQYLRWTDVLAEKLKTNAKTKNISVINMGIGANAIFDGQGTAAKDRFDRDVLQQYGVGYLIFMIGVNDIGSASDTDTTLAGRMIQEYTKMIEKAQKKGIRVFGGTITPFNGNSYYSVRREAIRQEVNEWLRQMYRDGKMDGLIDFDNHLKDPASSPPKILQSYNNDGLHPNMAGYKAMGELVYSIIAEDVTNFPPSANNPPSEPIIPPPSTIPPEMIRPDAPDAGTIAGYEEVNLENFGMTGGLSNDVIYDEDIGIYFSSIDSLNIPLKQALKSGDKIDILLQGKYENGMGYRSFLATNNGSLTSTTIAYGAMPIGATPAEATLTDTDYGFEWNFSLTAKDTSPILLFKGHAGATPLTGKFMLYRLYIKYDIK